MCINVFKGIILFTFNDVHVEVSIIQQIPAGVRAVREGCESVLQCLSIMQRTILLWKKKQDQYKDIATKKCCKIKNSLFNTCS